MSALRSAAEDYLRVRHALCYKLEVQGWLLDEFITHLEQSAATTVTIDAAVAWATLAGRGRPVILGSASVCSPPVRPAPADDRRGLRDPAGGPSAVPGRDARSRTYTNRRRSRR